MTHKNDTCYDRCFGFRDCSECERTLGSAAQLFHKDNSCASERWYGHGSLSALLLEDELGQMLVQ